MMTKHNGNCCQQSINDDFPFNLAAALKDLGRDRGDLVLVTALDHHFLIICPSCYQSSMFQISRR